MSSAEKAIGPMAISPEGTQIQTGSHPEGSHSAGSLPVHGLNWRIWLAIFLLTVATLAVLVRYSPRLHPRFDPTMRCTAEETRTSLPRLCA